MPDYSLLNSEKREKLRDFIKSQIIELIDSPLMTGVKILEFSKRNLKLNLN